MFSLPFRSVFSLQATCTAWRRVFLAILTAGVCDSVRPQEGAGAPVVEVQARPQAGGRVRVQLRVVSARRRRLAALFYSRS